MNSLEVKRYVKPIDLAYKFLGQPVKHNGDNIFYISPFRNEKTASLCVNNKKGFTDFGDGWHGDIFLFTQRLYKLNFKDSYNLLRQEFGLGEDNEYETTEIKRRLKEELEKKTRYEKAVKLWYEQNFNYLVSLYKEWIDIYQTNKDYTLKSYARQKIDYYDYLLEELKNADKFKLYEEVRNGGEAKKVLLPI